MAYPVVQKWLASSDDSIATLQDVAVNFFFVLDGTSVFPLGVPTAQFFNHASRTVSFTSANNNAGSTYIINGTYRNQPQTEAVIGPNNNTVESTNLFDTITSIQVVGFNSTQVSVGSGTTGVLPWIQYDYNRSLHSVAYQVVVSGTINYSLEQTLDDMQKLIDPTFVFDSATSSMTNQTVSKAASSNILPFSYTRIRINSSDNTGSLTFTYLETGIT